MNLSKKEMQSLFALTKKSQKKAYAPYSNFKVGCALLTTKGTFFSGCNVENASYGATVCAERVAIFSAVASGHRDFKALAIITPSGGSSCGLCLQVMVEFLKPHCPIYILSPKGEFKTYTIRQLLPEAFGAHSLKV